MRPRIQLVLVCVAGLTFAGCGDGDEPPSGAGPGTVVMTDYAFHPRNVSVRRGQTLQVRNQGGIAHNLKVEVGPNPRRETDELLGTPSFMKGDSEQLRIDLPPGRYVMVCSVPGHRELGMTGRLTVR